MDYLTPTLKPAPQTISPRLRVERSIVAPFQPLPSLCADDITSAAHAADASNIPNDIQQPIQWRIKPFCDWWGDWWGDLGGDCVKSHHQGAMNRRQFTEKTLALPPISQEACAPVRLGMQACRGLSPPFENLL